MKNITTKQTEAVIEVNEAIKKLALVTNDIYEESVGRLEVAQSGSLCNQLTASSKCVNAASTRKDVADLKLAAQLILIDVAAREGDENMCVAANHMADAARNAEEASRLLTTNEVADRALRDV